MRHLMYFFSRSTIWPVILLILGLSAACGGDGTVEPSAQSAIDAIASMVATNIPPATPATPTLAPVEPTADAVVPTEPPSAAATATVAPSPTTGDMAGQVALEETTAYQTLPEIALASSASVIATPLHPASYLDAPPIPAGTLVRVVARDNDASFLLVLHENKLNWIAAIAAGFVGNLDAPVVSEAPQGNCAGFLGASRASGETWRRSVGGPVAVHSLIYRPQPIGESPMLTVTETGQTLQPSIHHPLRAGAGEVVEITGSLADAPADSPITLQTTGLEGEPAVFQAVFMTDDCAVAGETLSAAPAQATGVITADGLAVWSAPGDVSNVAIGLLAMNDSIALTGSATDGAGRLWWRILLPSGEVGWVEEAGVAETGCLECVPVVPRTIVLHITSQVTAISGLLLIDAARDTTLSALESGNVIRLSDLPTRKLDVEAIAPGTATESVLFYLDGQLFCANHRCLENGFPYAMAGDLNQGDHYDNWDWSNMLGSHTISAVGCDQDNGLGTCGAPLTVQFTVTR